MDTNGKFYLGRIFDPVAGKTLQEPLFYDPADLTTHAVVVGMTGSGKTGLCLGLLEEAALLGLPALMIDPKGDITNALLHFPDMLPQDFEPWVNSDQARREGKTIQQVASETAASWKSGLADWGIGPERLLALKNAAHYAVYTPGSDAGIPVSILASLKAPEISWESHREILREKISGTVTALLGLVGGLNNIDPVRSKEHILLSNIFENAWSQGKDLDLGELILQTQTPPFAKLGVFDVNTFFPEKDRFSLAMLLNNILAAPAFQSWIEGQPLDIQALLYGPDGRPRHSVFYIAHLTDVERMFFVTLLYSAAETWMRSQSGTTSLRAIIYFDEIFGYLPPVSNPPSKQTMLRMLKQARAFGVGQVLVTQNPVDLDYKGLSNAGTWFIGKLQTEQDKMRLLDGLDSALSSATEGGLNRSEMDKLISSLGKRVFVMNNVHEKRPLLFQTRWAMNFMAGPLMRVQIRELNQLAGAQAPSYTPLQGGAATSATQPPVQSASAQPPAEMAKSAGGQPAPGLDQYQAIPVSAATQATQPGSLDEMRLGSETRPAVPTGVVEYFLPNNLTFSRALKASAKVFPEAALPIGLVYRPVVIGQAQARFLNRKYNLDCEVVKTILVSNPDRRGLVRWEQHSASPLDPRDLEDQPVPQARFAALEAPFTDARIFTAMQKDFLDWVYRSAEVVVKAHEALKLYAGPEVSPAEYRKMCADAARQARDDEIQKTTASLDRKIDSVQTRLAREERELASDQSEHSQRKLEEMGTHAENIFGLFNKRSSRRLSTSLTKRRLTEQAKADVDESLQAIAAFKKEIAALEKEREQVIAEINERWGNQANEITELTIKPLKKDVLIDLFGVAWMPYHVVRVGNQVTELPGFGEA